MQAMALLDKRRDGNDPSGLQNNFHDIESFLESVLVPTPVSISAELVPGVLSRGLGLASESYSLGQQGSNDRRSGRPRSSVSNGVQGNTNPTTVGAGAPKVRFVSDLTALNNNGMNPGINKDEAKNNNLVTTTSHQHITTHNQNNHAGEEEDPNTKKGAHRLEKVTRTRKRDNNSTAGGTSRKKKEKFASQAPNVFPLPIGTGSPTGAMPQMPAQYVFGMPQMGLPQVPPQHVQQMSQIQQIQQVQQMGPMRPMAIGPMGQMGTYMPYPPFQQLPDGRIVGFYPNIAPEQVPAQEKAEKELTADHTVKRSRLVWTDALHKKFLDAVERCGGIEQALPKAIMNDMKVMGLTRENVSSHLQKYRIRMKDEQERIEGGDKDAKDEDAGIEEAKEDMAEAAGVADLGAREARGARRARR